MGRTGRWRGAGGGLVLAAFLSPGGPAHRGVGGPPGAAPERPGASAGEAAREPAASAGPAPVAPAPSSTFVLEPAPVLTGAWTVPLPGGCARQPFAVTLTV